MSLISGCSSSGDDNNNNAAVDDSSTYYQDADSDGYGDPAHTQVSSTQPAGYVLDNTDCDDSSAVTYPGATELGDGIDNNCDGQIDEGLTSYYKDADNDGYGDPDITQMASSQPAGYVPDNTDCDDNSAVIYPGATELNDDIDNNCDGQIDEGLTSYYKDADNDSYGDPAITQMASSQPAGYVLDNTDCDDNSDVSYPGAIELGDGIDNNCDGQIDEGLTSYYKDADNDSYGDPASTQIVASQPIGYVLDNTDCDDSSAAVNPAAAEIVDGIDNNCDGQVDEGKASDYYPLSIGNTWQYFVTITEPDVPVQTKYSYTNISEIREFNSSTVYNFKTDLLTLADENENFFYSGEDDGIYFHGVFDENSNGGGGALKVTNTPPVLFLKSTFIVGDTWHTTTDVTIEEDGGVTETSPASWEYFVIAIEDVTVPAGTFQNCYKILKKEITSNPTITATDTIWLAKNVGIVKVKSDDGIYIDELQYASIDGTTHGSEKIQ